MTKGFPISPRVTVTQFKAKGLQGSQVVGAGLYVRMYVLGKVKSGTRKLVFIVEKGIVLGKTFLSEEKIEKNSIDAANDLFRECKQTIKMLVRGGRTLDKWPKGDVCIL